VSELESEKCLELNGVFYTEILQSTLVSGHAILSVEEDYVTAVTLSWKCMLYTRFQWLRRTVRTLYSIRAGL